MPRFCLYGCAECSAAPNACQVDLGSARPTLRARCRPSSASVILGYVPLIRAHSSAAERSAHNRLVTGSNPVGPTKLDDRQNLRFEMCMVVTGPEESCYRMIMARWLGGPCCPCSQHPRHYTGRPMSLLRSDQSGHRTVGYKPSVRDHPMIAFQSAGLPANTTERRQRCRRLRELSES